MPFSGNLTRFSLTTLLHVNSARRALSVAMYPHQRRKLTAVQTAAFVSGLVFV